MDRAVAGAPHPGGDVVPVVGAAAEGGEAAGRWQVAQDPGVVRVAAGEQRGPRGAAERVGDVVAAELDPAAADQVDRVGHGPRRPPHRGEPGRVQLLRGLIVGLDDEEARPRRPGGARSGLRGAHRAQQGEQRTKATTAAPCPARRAGRWTRSACRNVGRTAGRTSGRPWRGVDDRSLIAAPPADSAEGSITTTTSQVALLPAWLCAAPSLACAAPAGTSIRIQPLGSPMDRARRGISGAL